LPWVTFTLLFLNVTVFLLGLVLSVQARVPVNEYLYGSNNPKVLALLHNLGAVQIGDIVPGGDKRHWWRLLGCTFLHFGLLHLGANMYSLYAIGPLLERLWGSGRFLALYLIAGLGGSCAMVTW